MDGAEQRSSGVTDVSSEVDSTPLDLDDDLFDVQSELIPVTAKWRNIGTALQLKSDVLESIQAGSGGDPPACLALMVTEWLKRNYNVKRFGEPTWQKLVEVVGHSAGGANMTAARDIARRHKAGVSQMPANQQTPPRPQGGGETQMSPPPPSSTISNHPSPPRPSLEPAVVTSSLPHLLPQSHSAHQEQSRSVVFTRENQQAIMDKFADFQTKVCNKLVKNGVDSEQVRLFITNQFAPGDYIPPPPTSMTKMFEAITHHRLWNYFHYSPLVRIAKRFAANDDEMEGWVQTYKQDLKAYSLVTTVEDYIEADLSIDNDTPPAKRARYDPQYYTPVEWKTDFMDHSLQYLTEVWELFSSHYLVPDSPPTALLDRVRRGCFSITWLVPSGLIPQHIKRVQLDTEFFQQYRILKVTVGKECIYREIAEESTLEADLAHQKKTPPTNTPRGAEGGAEPHGSPQQETFGGYDCEFVEPPTSVFQTDCPICSLILRDPYLTSCCGTHFCHTCSERLQDEHKPCPTCREKNFELYPNKSLRRSLNQLHVLCTHSKDGCEWRGELGELERHLSEVAHSDSPPSPSSFKSKKMAATLSEESEAFRKCSADLIKEIGDPELLAWELYSSNVIPKKQVDEVSMVGLSVAHRKARLLSAVGEQIAVNPANFQNLLLVLGKQPSLKDIVKKLNETYRSHLKVGDRGTGLKEAVVLFDYTAKHGNMLSLKMGDVITDVKQSKFGGWYEGVLKGRRRLFPSNFVRFSRDIELQGQAWYHGWISQETAEERLNKVPYHCFLIRENGANLSLSMKHQGGISHFLIEKDSDGYEITGTDRKFDTLLQLVDFYMTNSVSGDPRHYLSSPCPRPSPYDVQRSSDTVPPHAPDSKSLLLHPHSRLRWRRVVDLPVAMTQHQIVRIGSTIYCGGGYTGKGKSRLVFQYNPKQDTWSQLLICTTIHFGLTQLDGKLVTVGGRRSDQFIPINDVYVFQDSETWENSIIPPLPTARMYPTAFNYKSTIVVSGGITHWDTDSEHSTYTDAVEVFQTKTYQWYHAEPLPVAYSNMSCAIVNDTCYLIGGNKSDGYASRQAYCTSLSNLISRALPPDHPETSSTPQASPSPPTWQVLPRCPLSYFTAAELGGGLLAIGGRDNSDSSSSAVHMYSPSTNSWVRISSGDLPVPRFVAAATQLEGGEVIFVGGDINLTRPPTKTVFIVSIEQ